MKVSYLMFFFLLIVLIVLSVLGVLVSYATVSYKSLIKIMVKSEGFYMMFFFLSIVLIVLCVWSSVMVRYITALSPPTLPANTNEM